MGSPERVENTELLMGKKRGAVHTLRLHSREESLKTGETQ